MNAPISISIPGLSEALAVLVSLAAFVVVLAGCAVWWLT